MVVEIKDSFIRCYGEYAIKTQVDDRVLVEKVLVTNSSPKFLRSPLLWIAFKIIDRHYRKQRKLMESLKRR